jgi:hypothetical protein
MHELTADVGCWKYLLCWGVWSGGRAQCEFQLLEASERDCECTFLSRLHVLLISVLRSTCALRIRSVQVQAHLAVSSAPEIFLFLSEG